MPCDECTHASHWSVAAFITADIPKKLQPSTSFRQNTTAAGQVTTNKQGSQPDTARSLLDTTRSLLAEHPRDGWGPPPPSPMPVPTTPWRVGRSAPHAELAVPAALFGDASAPRPSPSGAAALGVPMSQPPTGTAKPPSPSAGSTLPLSSAASAASPRTPSGSTAPPSARHALPSPLPLAAKAPRQFPGTAPKRPPNPPEPAVPVSARSAAESQGSAPRRTPRLLRGRAPSWIQRATPRWWQRQGPHAQAAHSAASDPGTGGGSPHASAESPRTSTGTPRVIPPPPPFLPSPRRLSHLLQIRVARQNVGEDPTEPIPRRMPLRQPAAPMHSPRDRDAPSPRSPEVPSDVAFHNCKRVLEVYHRDAASLPPASPLVFPSREPTAAAGSSEDVFAVWRRARGFGGFSREGTSTFSDFQYAESEYVSGGSGAGSEPEPGRSTDTPSGSGSGDLVGSSHSEGPSRRPPEQKQVSLGPDPPAVTPDPGPRSSYGRSRRSSRHSSGPFGIRHGSVPSTQSGSTLKGPVRRPSYFDEMFHRDDGSSVSTESVRDPRRASAGQLQAVDPNDPTDRPDPSWVHATGTGTPPAALFSPRRLSTLLEKEAGRRDGEAEQPIPRRPPPRQRPPAAPVPSPRAVATRGSADVPSPRHDADAAAEVVFHHCESVLETYRAGGVSKRDGGDSPLPMSPLRFPSREGTFGSLPSPLAVDRRRGPARPAARARDGSEFIDHWFSVTEIGSDCDDPSDATAGGSDEEPSKFTDTPSASGSGLTGELLSASTSALLDVPSPGPPKKRVSLSPDALAVPAEPGGRRSRRSSNASQQSRASRTRRSLRPRPPLPASPPPSAQSSAGELVANGARTRIATVNIACAVPGPCPVPPCLPVFPLPHSLFLRSPTGRNASEAPRGAKPTAQPLSP